MKKTTLLAIALGAMMFSSCDILNQLASDVAGVANLRNCEFNLKNVNNVSVAGVNVKNLTHSSSRTSFAYPAHARWERP